jgi:hypothetical protein
MSDQYVPAGFDAQDEMFLSPHSYTALPTRCRHIRHTHRIFMRCIGLAVVLLVTLPGVICADEFIPFPGPPPVFSHVPQNKSLIEARTGYLWGVNQIRFRDGDNAIIAPGKMELNVNGVIFGLQGETFASKDLAVRAQAWINIPQALRSDFFLDRTRSSWDTRAQYFEADLSIIYHLLPGGTPYTAGLTAGYRFDNFDYKSASVAIPGGSFNDHLHVHIPYLGIYYAHGSFVGSVVRLDVLASPFTISRLDATQDLAGSITQIDGQSLTGWWFESFFGWSRPVGRSAFLGAFAKYNYLGLSGGATLERDNASTRFSMDSWHNLFMTGLTATYTF